MGSVPMTRTPLDEAAFSAIERGILARARNAGFTVEMTGGSGTSGSSHRLTGRRDVGGTGLVQFSITRYHTTGKAECWLRFKHWPARPAVLAELRAELVLIATTGDTPL